MIADISFRSETGAKSGTFVFLVTGEYLFSEGTGKLRYRELSGANVTWIICKHKIHIARKGEASSRLTLEENGPSAYRAVLPQGECAIPVTLNRLSTVCGEGGGNVTAQYTLAQEEHTVRISFRARRRPDAAF